MKAAQTKLARMLMIAFALALTLMMGSICLAAGHECRCDNPLCPICQLLEPALAPVATTIAALAIAAISLAHRPACAMPRRATSLVCFRIRLDD